MLNGPGFMIWRLDQLPSLEELAKFIEYYELKWITIKTLDDDLPYNQIGGNDKILLQYFTRLAEICKVGMWQYVSGVRPGPSGAAVGTWFQKFEKVGASFVFADVEAGIWNDLGAGKAMDVYLDGMDLPTRIPVYLNSYRVVKNFPKFPFARALGNPRIKGMSAPQVYWEFAHNSADQLQACFDAYRQLPFSEFIPIGSTYWRGTPGASGSWGPTVADLDKFMAKVHELKLPAWGFYSLDKVWQHFNALSYTSGAAWMKAITGKDPPSSVPPPPTAGHVYPPLVQAVVIASDGLKVRSGPGPGFSQVESLKYGDTVDVLGEMIQSAPISPNNIWVRLGYKQYSAFVYNQQIMLRFK